MLALRNTKIIRDIATTCNRLYGKTEFTPFSNKTQETAQEHLQQDDYRYIVSNTSKPAVLPKFDFPPEEPQRLLLSEMRHLQPARQSKYISVSPDYNPLNVYEPQRGNLHKALLMECPFPRPIIEPQYNAMTFSEKSKGKTAFLKGSSPRVIPRYSIRNYSTSPFLIVARGLASKKKPADSKEKPKKTKKPCKQGSKCPHFLPKNCVASKGSHCEHYYTDPKCTKKMAPYKSYSETCHELLEDDPSECFQCPWQKCRGIENIKPPRKYYHTLRQYSTSQLDKGLVPTRASSDAPYFPPQECDKKKKPCKAPPPKCGKKDKTKKCPPLIKDIKRRCAKDITWTEANRLWSIKENVVPSSSWIALNDINRALIENLAPQLSVNTHSVDCKCNRCEKRSLLSTIKQSIAYTMKDSDCPREEDDTCPAPYSTIRPVPIDRSTNPKYKERDPCCQRAKRMRTPRKRTQGKPRVYIPEPPDYSKLPDDEM